MAVLAGLHFQEAPAPLYEQTYSIYIRGVFAGAESVSERRDKDGNRVCSSQHEMLVTDSLETKRMAFETTMVFVKGTAVPLSYSHKYLSGSKDFCNVAVKNGKISRVLSRGGNLSETTAALQPAAVILDVDVYYQYDIFARVYDFKKRGRQTFNDFLPVIGSFVPVAVTWLEDSKLDYGKGTIAVRNFKIDFFQSRTGYFSTDTSGRLVRLIIHDQDLEVVRKDLTPQPQETIKEH
jgi:hypothetical protein